MPNIPGTRSQIALATLLTAGLLTPVTGRAQSYERIAPKQAPAPAPADRLSAPPTPAVPEPASDRVILPVLKGLAFVPSAADVRPQGLAVAGVDTGGIDVLSRPVFMPIADAYIGKPLSLAGLNELSRKIVAFYRESDHPLVDVLVPEQDINNGTVQVVVREFRVGQVKAEGNAWFASDLLTRRIAEQPGDRVRGSNLLDEINGLNENPFRQVDLVYRPGTEPETTDLVLATKDRFPVRFYAGYDNSGVPTIGRDRWNLGFNWGNAFWQDQQLSYQFTSSDDFWHNRNTNGIRPDQAQFMGHSLSWTIPLPWSDKLQIFGSYEEAVPDIGPDFGQIGKSGQASIRYQMQLARKPDFVQSLEFGYDFKTTNNNLAFGGIDVSKTATEINQFSLNYAGSLNDRWGNTALSGTLVWSPGGLTGGNTTAAFRPGPGQAGRLGASADYVYVRGEADRLTALPFGMVWYTRLIGQVSDGPLLDTEQLGAGGADILRGYDEREANGDQGILFSTELRSPPLKLIGGGVDDAMQLLAFFDYGSLWNHDIPAGESDSAQLASTGLGLGYTVGTYVTMKLAYGWQLRKAPGAAARSQLAHLSLTLSY